MTSNQDPFLNAFQEMHQDIQKHIFKMFHSMSIPYKLTKHSLQNVQKVNMHQKPHNYFYHESKSIYKKDNKHEPDIKKVIRTISNGKEKIEVTHNNLKNVYERYLNTKQYKLLSS
jgi:hypothetical protein